MQYSSKDHTFVICAYGKSEFIEECIKSLLKQTLKTNIIMCTSTPSKYIDDIAEKYRIKLYVNKAKEYRSNIATDWNYAVYVANTPLVTIAHQDDIYDPGYAKKIIEYINMASHPIIAFTDYSELRNGERINEIRNLKIKRIMLYPLRNKRFWSSKFIRRRILSLGSAICCPSVTYDKDNLPDVLFDEAWKVSLDWNAWERFSQIEGDFVFVNDILMVHRIHKGSETTKNITDNNRAKEDYEMLCRFWPKRIAKIIEYMYKKGEDQNNV